MVPVLGESQRGEWRRLHKQIMTTQCRLKSDALCRELGQLMDVFILINLVDLRHFKFSRFGTKPPVFPSTQRGKAPGTQSAWTESFLRDSPTPVL